MSPQITHYTIYSTVIQSRLATAVCQTSSRPSMDTTNPCWKEILVSSKTLLEIRYQVNFVLQSKRVYLKQAHMYLLRKDVVICYLPK